MYIQWVSNISSKATTILHSLTNGAHPQLLSISVCRFDDLKSLSNVMLNQNMFESFPEVLYTVTSLVQINFKDNRQLYSIDERILNLHFLRKLNLFGCRSFSYPPKSVTDQGLPAVKAFFLDLKVESVTKLPTVLLAVLGNAMSGKTSLIRSLKSGVRQLTKREKGSELDEATRVFNIEEIKLDNSSIRCIDFGGQDVYHMTYQLAHNENILPCLVVNMEEFAELARQREAKEAARRLCFDWVAHFYLADPEAGAPLLVLTHKDRLTDVDFVKAKAQILGQSQTLKKEAVEDDTADEREKGRLCQIKHMSDESAPLFSESDIYELGSDDTTEIIKTIQRKIAIRSEEVTMAIPGLWNRVQDFLTQRKEEPYLLLSSILDEFPGQEVILQYLHRSGQIVWYSQHTSLQRYVFPDIQKITDTVATVFNHSSSEKWQQRKAEYKPFVHAGVRVDRHTYASLVEQFIETGIISDFVLEAVLKTESKIEPKIAINLLKAFFVIHGPITQERRKAYIAPSLTTQYMDNQWEKDERLTVRVDIKYIGITIPKHIYQRHSVSILNKYATFTDTVNVYRNGVSIVKGQGTITLIHHPEKCKETLQISTETEQIHTAWEILTTLANALVNETTTIWKAAHPICVFYCSHCLYMQHPDPYVQTTPIWFFPTAVGSEEEKPFTLITSRGVEYVSCKNEASKKRPTVPKPLLFPC